MPKINRPPPLIKLLDSEPFDCPLASLDLSGEIWQGLANHCKKVNDADLSKPIILAWDGQIVDGRHRILKAIIKGKRTIKAVRMHWRPDLCRNAE